MSANNLNEVPCLGLLLAERSFQITIRTLIFMQKLLEEWLVLCVASEIPNSWFSTLSSLESDHIKNNVLLPYRGQCYTDFTYQPRLSTKAIPWTCGRLFPPHFTHDISLASHCSIVIPMKHVQTNYIPSSHQLKFSQLGGKSFTFPRVALVRY